MGVKKLEPGCTCEALKPEKPWPNGSGRKQPYLCSTTKFLKMA